MSKITTKNNKFSTEKSKGLVKKAKKLAPLGLATVLGFTSLPTRVFAQTNNTTQTISVENQNKELSTEEIMELIKKSAYNQDLEAAKAVGINSIYTSKDIYSNMTSEEFDQLRKAVKTTYNVDLSEKVPNDYLESYEFKSWNLITSFEGGFDPSKVNFDWDNGFLEANYKVATWGGGASGVNTKYNKNFKGDNKKNLKKTYHVEQIEYTSIVSNSVKQTNESHVITMSGLIGISRQLEKIETGIETNYRDSSSDLIAAHFHSLFVSISNKNEPNKEALKILNGEKNSRSPAQELLQNDFINKLEKNIQSFSNAETLNAFIGDDGNLDKEALRKYLNDWDTIILGNQIVFLAMNDKDIYDEFSPVIKQLLDEGYDILNVNGVNGSIPKEAERSKQDEINNIVDTSQCKYNEYLNILHDEYGKQYEFSEFVTILKENGVIMETTDNMRPITVYEMSEINVKLLESNGVELDSTYHPAYVSFIPKTLTEEEKVIWLKALKADLFENIHVHENVNKSVAEDTADTLLKYKQIIENNLVKTLN